MTAWKGNPVEAAQRDGLLGELRAVGQERGDASIRRLLGGYVADVWLVTYADGIRVVGAPAGMFRAEAEGLAALRTTGHLQTPRVLAVTGQLLLLEALAARDDSDSSWEAFAHDLFGWPHDGYLGRVVQQNPWTASGHEFFAQHRILRYLEEPLVQQELTHADRRALERYCDRLTGLIPVMPAVLTHGDLWAGNLLSRDDGRITAINPAVSYTWAEVDLSMLWGCQRPPPLERFFGFLSGTQSFPAGLARAHAAAPPARTAEQHGPPRRRR